MESVLLDTPEGITARLAWDPKVPEQDRRRHLAKQLVADRLEVEPGEVRVDREAPGAYGFQPRMVAEVAGEEVPLVIDTASFRGATVVAVSEPGLLVGLDVRDAHPDEAELRTMRRHSHLWDENDLAGLIAHWTRVQAVRDADGRGAKVAADKVRLNSPLTKGWIGDRQVEYRLTDLSRDGWIITLAHAPAPA